MLHLPVCQHVSLLLVNPIAGNKPPSDEHETSTTPEGYILIACVQPINRQQLLQHHITKIQQPQHRKLPLIRTRRRRHPYNPIPVPVTLPANAIRLRAPLRKGDGERLGGTVCAIGLREFFIVQWVLFVAAAVAVGEAGGDLVDYGAQELDTFQHVVSTAACRQQTNHVSVEEIELFEEDRSSKQSSPAELRQTGKTCRIQGVRGCELLGCCAAQPPHCSSSRLITAQQPIATLPFMVLVVQLYKYTKPARSVWRHMAHPACWGLNGPYL
mgnify:CR=1 FL=1